MDVTVSEAVVLLKAEATMPPHDALWGMADPEHSGVALVVALRGSEAVGAWVAYVDEQDFETADDPAEVLRHHRRGLVRVEE